MAEDARTGAVDLTGEKIHWDLEGGMSYGSYLALEKILNAQSPRSEHHDEMLFIVIHQVSELWMKLSLHELEAVVGQIQKDQLGPAFKMLARVSRIQGQLIIVVGCSRHADTLRLQLVPGCPRQELRISVLPVPDSRVLAR